MTTAHFLSDKPRLLKIAGLSLLALAGGGTGYLIGNATGIGDLPWEDALALFMAAILMVSAVGGLAVMATRPASVPKGCGALQVIILGLAALMLATPTLAPADVPPEGVFAGVLALMALQTWANVQLWSRADEMLRRVTMESAVLAFWALQGALFLYAVAERLGLVGSVSAWGMTGILMATYLVASSIAASRRGLK